MRPEEKTGARQPGSRQKRSAAQAAASRKRKTSAAARSGSTERRKVASRPGTEKKKTAAASSRSTRTAQSARKTGTTRSAARRTDRRSAGTAKRGQSRVIRRPEATPEVVYTPARPVSRNRFLLQLMTVVAVVLAMTFVVSLFFKVETVTVTGADLYDPWTVREASGIEEGDGLLTFSRARAGGRIRTALPYVEKVMIGIKLPNTVNIMIEEADVGYVIEAEDGSLWLMSATGKILEKTTPSKAAGHAVITGVELAAPVGTQAEPSTGGTTDVFGETIPMVVTGQDRLDTLLEILQNLEISGIIGKVVSIDLTDYNNLELWYGDRFQVKLGDGNRIAMKIESMAKAIDQMSQYDSGVLDVSYTTWPDKVGFMAFD